MKAAIKRFPDRYFLVYFRPYYISYVMSKNVSLVVCHNTLLRKKVIWQIQRKYKLKIFNNFGVIPGGVFPYKTVIGMCRLMGSHFQDWSDYNGVAFSKDLLEWGRKFSDFGDK